MRCKIADLRKWHAWFAWHPIRVDEELVWLERIERRADPSIFPFDLKWQYRVPSIVFDLEQES